MPTGHMPYPTGRLRTPSRTASVHSTPRWCFEALGVEPGANHSDVRRAYLAKARETHPDKGGSADDFRRIVLALKACTGKPNGVPEVDPLFAQNQEDHEEEACSSSKFSMEEVSRLAAEVRRLNAERKREEREEREGRFEEREERRRISMEKAAEARQKEEAVALSRALLRQRRTELPQGVEFVSGSSLFSDVFRARSELGGVQRYGPIRRTIAQAEMDSQKVERVRLKHGEDAAVKALERLKRMVPRSTWH